MREPVMLVSGPVTDGNSITTPLLSVANKLTGFGTWLDKLSVVITQPVDGHS
jgi:hypothetical protein